MAERVRGAKIVAQAQRQNAKHQATALRRADVDVDLHEHDSRARTATHRNTPDLADGRLQRKFVGDAARRCKNGDGRSVVIIVDIVDVVVVVAAPHAPVFSEL